MTHASPRLKQTTPRRRAGFTLIELLISVGILALLTGLILAGVIRSRRSANIIRVKDDLGMIDTAISAYKDEFGDIPRFADAATDYATNASGNVTGTGYWLDTSQTRGAVLLCRALIGPGAAATGATPGTANVGDDGADGPGFRTRRIFNSTTGQFSGKVYGPYLDAGKFKIGYALDNTGQPIKYLPVLLDIFGNAILYYPAAPGTPQGNLGYSNPSNYNPANPPLIPRFNAFDNSGMALPAPKDAQHPNAWMNNADFNTLAAGCGSPPYLLWTAGQDGVFGLTNATYGTDANGNPIALTGKTGNIANFDMPANLKK
jgi:prepilin-type N-terminal cleavage/methylation domain-containing protein